MTTKELAAAFNVSERMIYMSRELLRTGRDDLVAKVDAGQMTVLAALREAKPAKYRGESDRLKALKAAWLKASEEERGAFLVSIGWKT